MNTCRYEEYYVTDRQGKKKHSLLLLQLCIQKWKQLAYRKNCYALGKAWGPCYFYTHARRGLQGANNASHVHQIKRQRPQWASNDKGDPKAADESSDNLAIPKWQCPVVSLQRCSSLKIATQPTCTTILPPQPTFFCAICNCIWPGSFGNFWSFFTIQRLAFNLSHFKWAPLCNMVLVNTSPSV